MHAVASRRRQLLYLHESVGFSSNEGQVIVPSHYPMDPVAKYDRLLPFDFVGGGADCLIAIENIAEHVPHMTSYMTPSVFEQLCVKL